MSNPLTQTHVEMSTGTSLDEIEEKKGDQEEIPQDRAADSSKKKKETIAKEFWLSVTVEMDTPNFSNETTGAKLYMKWTVQRPRLFELNKEQQMKTLKEKMLVFDEKFFPSSDTSRQEETLLKMVDDSDRNRDFMAKGCYLNSLDQGTFPVNPDTVIKNEVPGSQRILTPLCWVQLDPLKQTMTCQLTLTVQVYSRFSMLNFPFDQHVIPMALQIKRPWKDKDGVEQAWVLAKEKPPWAPKGWKGRDQAADKIHLVENVANVDPSSELKHVFPVIYFINEGKIKSEMPVMCLRIYRDPTNKIISVTGPVCCIGMISLVSFFLEFNNVEDRLNMLSLAVLALAAYKSVLEGMIPQKSYLTLADKYVFLGFAFFAFLALKVVLVFQGLSNSGVGFFWYKGPSDDDENDDWDHLSPKYQDVDDATSLFALVVWSLLHIIPACDCIQRALKDDFDPAKEGEDEIKTTFLDTILRKKWKKLYEEEAEITKFKKKFNHKYEDDPEK